MAYRGYARYRNVFSQGTTDGSAYVWANESLKAVKAVAGATVEFFQKLYGFSVNTYGAARKKIDEAARGVHDGTIATGCAVEASAVEAANAVGERSAKISKGVISRANEAARVYDAAQRMIVLKYIAAQNELLRQIEARLDSAKK